MSEIKSLVDAEPEAPARKAAANAKSSTNQKGASPIKLSVKPARKTNAKPHDLPPGRCAVYVAIPGRVSRGNSAGKADAGEVLIVGETTADELELRGLACRDENEAKGLFTRFKRKEEKRISAAVNVAAKRQAARDRAKREQIAASKLEWVG